MEGANTRCSGQYLSNALSFWKKILCSGAARGLGATPPENETRVRYRDRRGASRGAAAADDANEPTKLVAQLKTDRAGRRRHVVLHRK